MNNLDKAFRDQKKSTQQVNKEIYGSLGIRIDGRKNVEVPNRQGFVYVRLRDNQNEVVQAFNNKVAASYNLPVTLEREGNRYIVKGVNTQRYENIWNNSAPYLPLHGQSHSFPKGGGGDIVWIFENQIMPALVYPNTNTGTNVKMYSYPFLSQDNSWKLVGNTGTQEIISYRPITGAMSLMVLVYLDSITGNPGILVNSGTQFSQNITGGHIYQYLPSPSLTQIPLAGVLLNTGTSRISWENIYGVRQWIHSRPTGTSSGGGSGTLVSFQDEGVSQGSSSTLNVLGPTSQIIVTGTLASLYISGSTQYDIFNGMSLSAGELEDGDFWGLLDASNNYFVAKTAYSQLKESLRLFFNRRYQPSGSVAHIQDDGVPQGTAYTFNFGEGLSASISGSVAQVSNTNAPVQDYISGLEIDYLTSGSIQVNPGQAYVPSLSRNVIVTGSISITLPTPLPTGTWQGVYLYEVGGVASIQVTGTAPSVPYSGRARTKSGDTTYRYLGSLLPDGGGYLYRFATNIVGGSLEMNWIANPASSPFSFSNLTGTTPQNVNVIGLMPHGMGGIADQILIVGALTIPASTVGIGGFGETIPAELGTTSAEVFFRIDNVAGSSIVMFFPPATVKIGGTTLQQIVNLGTVSLLLRARGIRIPRS